MDNFNNSSFLSTILCILVYDVFLNCLSCKYLTLYVFFYVGVSVN